MKYRRIWVKPALVEAEQWHKPLTYKWKEKDDLGVYFDQNKDVFYLDTEKGREPVGDGFWIVTDAKGRKHVYSPEIFEKTYEQE